MDPYIDPRALDPAHPLTPRKLENLARASAAYQGLEERVEARPVKVTFQTNETCNLACLHCQIPPDRKRRTMSPVLLDLLRTHLLPDLVELHPTNIGEPLAWPHFRRLCHDLAEHGVLLDLTTNGTLLDSRRIAWFAPVVRDVKVSFDGARKATFERFRRGASFDRTCDNVRGLVTTLRRVAVRRPQVALQMTLMKDNFRELPDLVRLAADLGADRVKAYHLFSFSTEMDAQSLMARPALLLEYDTQILPETLGLGETLGVDLRVAEPSGGSPRTLLPRTCFLPWHETWIDLDGSVRVCHSFARETAGRLDAFEQAWNGPLYRQVRAGFASGSPRGPCEACGMNFAKREEHAPVPYDRSAFLHESSEHAPLHWSGRMRPFDIQPSPG